VVTSGEKNRKDLSASIGLAGEKNIKELQGGEKAQTPNNPLVVVWGGERSPKRRKGKRRDWKGGTGWDWKHHKGRKRKTRIQRGGVSWRFEAKERGGPIRKNLEGGKKNLGILARSGVPKKRYEGGVARGF